MTSGVFQRIQIAHLFSGFYAIVLSQEREGEKAEIVFIPSESVPPCGTGQEGTGL